MFPEIQNSENTGVFEMRVQILTTTTGFMQNLEKIFKKLCQKIK
jgi:hypothetical protein